MIATDMLKRICVPLHCRPTASRIFIADETLANGCKTQWILSSRPNEEVEVKLIISGVEIFRVKVKHENFDNNYVACLIVDNGEIRINMAVEGWEEAS